MKALWGVVQNCLTSIHPPHPPALFRTSKRPAWLFGGQEPPGDPRWWSQRNASGGGRCWNGSEVLEDQSELGKASNQVGKQIWEEEQCVWGGVLSDEEIYYQIFIIRDQRFIIGVGASCWKNDQATKSLVWHWLQPLCSAQSNHMNVKCQGSAENKLAGVFSFCLSALLGMPPRGSFKSHRSVGTWRFLLIGSCLTNNPPLKTGSQSLIFVFLFYCDWENKTSIFI